MFVCLCARECFDAYFKLHVRMVVLASVCIWTHSRLDKFACLCFVFELCVCARINMCLSCSFLKLFYASVLFYRIYVYVCLHLFLYLIIRVDV